MVFTLSMTTPYAFRSGHARRYAGGDKTERPSIRMYPRYAHFLSAGARQLMQPDSARVTLRDSISGVQYTKIHSQISGTRAEKSA
jgi:hypothetical protein